jgi:hypothetical protein
MTRVDPRSMRTHRDRSDGNIQSVPCREVAYHAWKAPGGIWETEVFVEENPDPSAECLRLRGGDAHRSQWIPTGTLLFDNLRPFYSYKSPGASSFVTTQIEYGGGWADVNYGAMDPSRSTPRARPHDLRTAGNILVLTLAKLYYATAEPGGDRKPGCRDRGRCLDLVDNCLRIGPDGTIHVVYLGYEDSRSVLKYRTSEDGGETWGSAHTVDDTAYSGNDQSSPSTQREVCTSHTAWKPTEPRSRGEIRTHGDRVLRMDRRGCQYRFLWRGIARP